MFASSFFLFVGVMSSPHVDSGIMAPWIIRWSVSTMELKVFLNKYDYYLFLVFECFWQSRRVALSTSSLRMRLWILADQNLLFRVPGLHPSYRGATRCSMSLGLLQDSSHWGDWACPIGRRPGMPGGLRILASAGTPWNSPWAGGAGGYGSWA